MLVLNVYWDIFAVKEQAKVNHKSFSLVELFFVQSTEVSRFSRVSLLSRKKVIRHGELVGVITKKDLLQFIYENQPQSSSDLPYLPFFNWKLFIQCFKL